MNPKFQASSYFLWLYSPVCVRPGRKTRRPVFSQRGSNFDSRAVSAPFSNRSSARRHLTAYQFSPTPMGGSLAEEYTLLKQPSQVLDSRSISNRSISKFRKGNSKLRQTTTTTTTKLHELLQDNCLRTVSRTTYRGLNEHLPGGHNLLK